MKTRRQELREQLEAGMAIFLSQGKEITKAPAVKTKDKKSKEQVVEIEVNFLPLALQTKYFGS